MDEIARTAGVGKGTLYRRYPDKVQLCLALMDACFHTFRETEGGERGWKTLRRSRHQIRRAIRIIRIAQATRMQAKREYIP